MSIIDRLGLRALQRLDPERAHGLAIKALKLQLGQRFDANDAPDRLRCSVMGLDFPHPLGLAAGFDKNAEAVGPLLAAGFAFVEVGAVTPRAQPGNPKPRMFRLKAEEAAINRFGFNNQGMEAVRPRLSPVRRLRTGLNLGANKDSDDRAADYGTVLRHLGDRVGFATVNVSSPNTEGLRDLQAKDTLRDLLTRTLAVRDEAAKDVRLLLKIAPDLSDAQITDVAEIALETGIDGIIATNTTLSREGVSGPHSGEKGGLSGQPMFERSTEVLRRLARETGGKLPLIGVGGVGSAEQAYAKIRAGASLLQLYTALSYHGLGLIPDILEGLDWHLQRDGFETLAEAVGADNA